MSHLDRLSDFVNEDLLDRLKNLFAEMDTAHSKSRQAQVRSSLSSYLYDARMRVGVNFDRGLSDYCSLSRPEALRTLLSDIVYGDVTTERGCLALEKKLDRFLLHEPENEWARQQKEYTRLCLELFEELREKEANIGKKKPSVPAKPVSPDQVRGSCACCFRDIALDGREGMALHGYSRPWPGMQTGSCPGARVPCLEISVRGLEWNIGNIQKRLEKLPELIKEREDAYIKETSPSVRKNLKREIHLLELAGPEERRALAFAKEALVVWKKRHEAGEFADFLKGTALDPEKGKGQRETADAVEEDKPSESLRLA